MYYNNRPERISNKKMMVRHISTLIMHHCLPFHFPTSGQQHFLNVSLAVGTYSCTFKSVIFESVKVKSVKIKNLLKSVRMVQ